jgi:hypothetical protein
VYYNNSGIAIEEKSATVHSVMVALVCRFLHKHQVLQLSSTLAAERERSHSGHVRISELSVRDTSRHVALALSFGLRRRSSFSPTSLPPLRPNVDPSVRALIFNWSGCGRMLTVSQIGSLRYRRIRSLPGTRAFFVVA